MDFLYLMLGLAVLATLYRLTMSTVEKTKLLFDYQHDIVPIPGQTWDAHDGCTYVINNVKGAASYYGEVTYSVYSPDGTKWSASATVPIRVFVRSATLQLYKRETSCQTTKTTTARTAIPERSL